MWQSPHPWTYHPVKGLLPANSFLDCLCPVAHSKSLSWGRRRFPNNSFVLAGASSLNAVGSVKSSAAQGWEATNPLEYGCRRQRDGWAALRRTQMYWRKRPRLDMYRTTENGRVAAVVDRTDGRWRASVVVFFAVEEQSNPISRPATGVHIDKLVDKWTEHQNVRTVPLSADGSRTLTRAQQWVESWHDNADDLIPPR